MYEMHNINNNSNDNINNDSVNWCEPPNKIQKTNDAYQLEEEEDRNEFANEFAAINNKIPSTLLVCKTIQNQESLRPMKVLLDSGGSATLIHEKCLPPGATSSLLPEGQTNFQTTAGLFSATRQVFS